MAANENYKNYQDMVADVRASLSQAAQLCGNIPLEEKVRQLEEQEERMRNQTFRVGIMGEFNRGKSTVINAILGEKVLPADILPCTATLNRIRWDTRKRAEVSFKDGRVENVPVDQLTKYLTKLTKESLDLSETVRDAVVYYPTVFCQNGVEIIDTPGLNDEAKMNVITENVIPTLDATIFVLSADAPLQMSERDFIRNKLLTSDMARVLFVLNKIDYLEEEDRERQINYLRDSIHETMLDKIADLHGKDSEEYQRSAQKLGSIKIFPISARDALNGRIKNNAGKVEDSGILAFEEELSRMLTKESGMLRLMTPINAVGSVIGETRQIIEMRKKALSMDKEEFEKAHEESIRVLEESKQKREKKLEEIKGKGDETYEKLLPQIPPMYDEVEASAMRVADTLTKDDVSSSDKQEAALGRISEDIRREIERQLSVQTEKLMGQIQKEMALEAEQAVRFATEIETQVIDVRGKFTGTIFEDQKDDLTYGAASGVIGLAATGVLGTVGGFGIGAAIDGWKQSGLKGAALGLASGGAIGFGTSIALTSALVMLGISSSILFLPVCAIGGIAGKVGGRKIVDAVFGNQLKLEQTKEAVRQAIQESMQEVRSERVLENWLREKTTEIFQVLSEQVQEQVGSMLNDMESQLNRLKNEMENNRNAVEMDVSAMENLDDQLVKINMRLDSIRTVVVEALSI